MLVLQEPKEITIPWNISMSEHHQNQQERQQQLQQHQNPRPFLQNQSSVLEGSITHRLHFRSNSDAESNRNNNNVMMAMIRSQQHQQQPLAFLGDGSHNITTNSSNNVITDSNNGNDRINTGTTAAAVSKDSLPSNPSLHDTRLDGTAAAVATEEGDDGDAASLSSSTKNTSTKSPLEDMVENEKQSRRRKDFPYKLHCMLEEVEKCNQQHIVSWVDGKSFRVYRPDEFVAKIMPHYFHQTQYRSFQRMLNLYEFHKVVVGANRGSYSHPKFIRSDRSLCLQMRIRKRTKKASPSGIPTSSSSAETSASAVANKMGKKFADGTGDVCGSRLTDFQQRQLHQQFMSRGGFLPNPNLAAPTNSESHGLMQQQQQPLFQNSEYATSRGGYSASDTPPSILQHMEPTTKVTFGTHGSVTTSISADPASLHHHQLLTACSQLKNDSDYDSQKIQTTNRQDTARNQQLLNFLPASWNSTVSSRDFGSEATQPEDGRLYTPMGNVSYLRSNDEDAFSAKLKKVEDPLGSPLYASNFSHMAAHQDGSYFPSSSSSAAAAANRAMPQEPSTMGHQHQSQTQEQPPPPQQQHQQRHDHSQQQSNIAMFELPLSSDLEPTPLPP
mmetsp:Transcript_18708/g.32960  ORF Transcript_18708/g.32960 Transcript_18708/m.32960 type:complete len:613 (+) Transcript_18708:265-2103(+)